MRIGKFILGCYGLLFVVFGLVGFLLPDQVTPLIEYGLNSSVAKMEFMATYGGLFIGLGVFMFYCIKQNVQIGLVSVIFTMGAMLLARLIGYFSFGGGNAVQYIYLAGELITVILVGYILFRFSHEFKA